MPSISRLNKNQYIKLLKNILDGNMNHIAVFRQEWANFCQITGK